jgi:hypothetical protein
MSVIGKPYGPGNLHPLSQLRTELVWEGKYDEYGNRREFDVAGFSMPVQRIETIDQPRSEPPRVCRRLFRLSHAAMARCSVMA